LRIVATGLPRYLGETTLFEDEGRYWFVLSYSLPTTFARRIVTETLAWEVSEDGDILDLVPVLVDPWIVDHKAFVKKIPKERSVT
jgi:hypothetical protein